MVRFSFAGTIQKADQYKLDYKVTKWTGFSKKKDAQIECFVDSVVALMTMEETVVYNLIMFDYYSGNNRVQDGFQEMLEVVICLMIFR